MPRRKKNEQSPTRVRGGPPPLEDFGLGPPQGYDLTLASNFSHGKEGSDRQKITLKMQEIFSHLDPEVIHIVLSEADFKVENAMDSLLELSIAAELAGAVDSPMCGFESTAAALLSPRHVSQPGSSAASEQLTSPSPTTSLLTEELDLQVDQELQNLAAQQEDHTNNQCLSADMTLSSLPPSQFPEQVFPELQFNQEPQSGHLEGGLVLSGAPSPFDGLNTCERGSGDGQKSLVDFKHLVAEESADRPKSQLDLVASGRPSAFQLYKKNESSQMLLQPSENADAGATTASWNIHAPTFSPRLHGNQGPCFITPIAPSHHSIGRPSPWGGQASQAPLRPSATIPKSWAMAAAAHNPSRIAPSPSSRLHLEGKVLVLLRGASGSGKSTLARALVENNPGGVALSTDDYFTFQGRYHYDPASLGEAHEWNHKRAKEAFERGASPIIIDNTNMQGWEMKPYVAQALKYHYKVLFRETDTWWKNKPRELERRSTHGVSAERIRRMLNDYERFVTVKSIMGATMPECKMRLHLENRNVQCVTPEAKCPDLVSEPGLMDRRKNSQPHLFSSLPDVSSIDHPSEFHKLEGDNHQSTESLDFQPVGSASESSHKDVDLDLGVLDFELDARNQPGAEQGIPDCIVESVMNEDHRNSEPPVAFSQSIKQRLPRKRTTRNFESADLVKELDHPDGLAMGKEQMNKEEVSVAGGEEKEMSKMLHFVGDWPSEGPLDQRQARGNKSHKDCDGSEDREVSKEVSSDTSKVQFPNPEMQKMFDIIQNLGGFCESVSSSSPSPVSPCLEQNLETDDKIQESLRDSSEGGEKEQNMNPDKIGRVDLPDCVLDWKAAESHKDNGEILKSENETSRTAVSDIGCETESDAAANTWSGVTASEPPEPKEGCATEHEYGRAFASAIGTEMDTNQRKEQTDSEVTVQPQSEHSSDGTAPLEPQRCGKQRHGRRSGKQCKLALTFTQNCPAHPFKTLDDPDTTSQMVDITTHPDFETSLSPKLDSCIKLEEEEVLPQSDSPLSLERGCPTQTEPQDFALLWRLNHQDSRADHVAAAFSDITVLCGVSSRFVPEISSAVSAAVAVHPSTQNTVPYRMVHEKGTQVEEKEFVATQSRLESLTILSRHFKLVSLDTLEDLYDKCHQDLEWTTNLLLDSGERLFKDEDVLEEEAGKVEQSIPLIVTSLETKLGDEFTYAKSTAVANVLQQSAYEEVPEIAGTSDTDFSGFAGTASPVKKKTQLETHLHTVTTSPSLPTMEKHGEIQHQAIFEESSFATPDDIASLEEIHRLLQAELEELEREERQKKDDERTVGNRDCPVLNINSVELKLPTELALQLTELFGPVGIEPGTCSSEDYAVQMDMNLAKLLHQKWKDSIQERKRQATLSNQLLLDRKEAGMPVMDHWNFSQPCVSLRDIIKEELAMQENMTMSRQNRAELNKRDGASMLKEDQLYARFPSIDRHFLQDIFRDHNYCLSQTELFLNSLLDQGPVKTVVAPELPRSGHQRAPSKEREKKLPDSDVAQKYQNIDDPEYKDFRAEASLQRSRQLESFSKAAAAYKQGHREVASFYAQQGHLHGHRMREANHRAAVQIFERVNSSLLPKNILDLHGLHVDEALEHLRRILHDKTADCEQGLCRPQLSVITGRGNHSQGGVARIRPAVINYLTNTHYRFTEPKPGLVVVSLK
ncbi:NEDD4-binding protein 2 isoform X2 [Syngnathus acus]|uniref:NEDD4-binding protein 2 isoform X2 n=1 Tax=Syngnathus acus TaxID=161584 RepID=UPI001885DD67|nr:NEDD4-binding protein 2 isoform X2 [Syngnathus acus]